MEYLSTACDIENKLWHGKSNYTAVVLKHSRQLQMYLQYVIWIYLSF